jgi:hypothetical protein
MQDRTLADLSADIDRDRRLDVGRLLEDASRASRGELTPKDTRKALLKGITRTRVQDRELDLLIKRYEIPGDRGGSPTVDTRKLVDDLAQGRVAEPARGVDTTPRSRAEEARMLEDATKAVAAAADRGAGTGALFAAFSADERGGSGGTTSAGRFTSQLAKIGAQLSPSQEKLLTAHYAAPGSNGSIEYRRFLEDLGRLGGRNRRPTVALTQGQEDLLRRGKAFLSE